jgi:hypothetical protein
MMYFTSTHKHCDDLFMYIHCFFLMISFSVPSCLGGEKS